MDGGGGVAGSEGGGCSIGSEVGEKFCIGSSMNDDEEVLSDEDRRSLKVAVEKWHQEREGIEKKLSDPTLPAKEREKLMYLYHPPETRLDELTYDGQCRINLRRLLKAQKWPKHDELLKQLCRTLVAAENKDKLLALMAMKHQSRDQPGKGWAKAVIWLLKSWNWLSDMSAKDAVYVRELGVQFFAPTIQSKASKQAFDRIQEMIWHLLPKINGSDRAWQLAAEDEAIHQLKVEEVPSSAIAADLKMTDETVRKKHSRAKNRAKKQAAELLKAASKKNSVTNSGGIPPADVTGIRVR